MGRAKQKVEVVTWQEPPERPHQYPWAEIADELRSRPMEWAKIFEGDRASVVIAIRSGSIAPVNPNLGFEIRTANNTREGIRKCDLYLRYNPDRESGLASAIAASRKKES